MRMDSDHYMLKKDRPNGQKIRPIILIVYIFCISLLLSSIISLFFSDDDVKEIVGSGKDTYDVNSLNQDMGEFVSGLIKEANSEEVHFTRIDNATKMLENDFDGYRMEFTGDWKLDDKEFRSVIHLRTEGTKITIYKHGINLTFERVSNYLWYSNDNIRKDHGPITHISDDDIIISGRKFTTVTYEREPISTIDNDMNMYRQYHYNFQNRSVYSFIIKTSPSSWSDSIARLEKSLSTLSTWQVEEQKDSSPVPDEKIKEIEIAGKTKTISIPENRKVFGLWHQIHKDYWIEVDELERDTDHEFRFIMDYFNFRNPYTYARDYIEKQYDEGNVMLVSLQPYVSSHGEDYDSNVVLFDMLNGEYDDLLLGWARGLKEIGEPVFLRFGNEMNGDWTQWCSWFYGLDPDLFIMAWARLYTIFDQVGADNVQFVWNPHDRTYPDYDWQAPYLYYPGDDMVDWIGLTAYNNGVTRPTEHWRDIDECYKDLYDDYMRRYSSKPFMITEFACNEIGGDKSKWITEGLYSLFHEYPNIWMMVWWNGVDDTWIYDIDSSEASLDAFRKAIDDPAVLEDPWT